MTFALCLGDDAPDFELDSSEGPLRFHDWLAGSWGLLMAHPGDFTPVCTTELGQAARLAPEFARRGVKLLALTVDTVASHQRWIADINHTQHTELRFPILADVDRKVCTRYGLIHPNASATVPVRALLLVDPARKIRLSLSYPASVGRSFDEILRVIDALQLTDAQPLLTPAGWRAGDPVLISPELKDLSLLRRLFPQGFDSLRPYLRYTSWPRRPAA